MCCPGWRTCCHWLPCGPPVSVPGRSSGGLEAPCLQVSRAGDTGVLRNSYLMLASSWQVQKQILSQSSLTFLYCGWHRERKAVPKTEGIVVPRLGPELENRDEGVGCDTGPRQMAPKTPGPVGPFLDPLLVAQCGQWVRFLFASKDGSCRLMMLQDLSS